jgi:hypothetical protein
VSFLRIVPFGRRPRAMTAVENSNLKSHVPQADFSDKFRHGVPRLLLPPVHLPLTQRITIVQDSEMPDGDDERCLDDLIC